MNIVKRLDDLDYTWSINGPSKAHPYIHVTISSPTGEQLNQEQFNPYVGQLTLEYCVAKTLSKQHLHPELKMEWDTSNGRVEGTFSSKSPVTLAETVLNNIQTNVALNQLLKLLSIFQTTESVYSTIVDCLRDAFKQELGRTNADSIKVYIREYSLIYNWRTLLQSKADSATETEALSFTILATYLANVSPSELRVLMTGVYSPN